MTEQATQRVLPGHPVKDGAGYDCNCGGCLALPVRRAEYEADAPTEYQQQAARALASQGGSYDLATWEAPTEDREPSFHGLGSEHAWRDKYEAVYAANVHLAAKLERAEALNDENLRLHEQAGVMAEELERLRPLAAKLEQVRELAESWKYKGEHGWGPWQQGYGPGPEDQILDGASHELLRILDQETAP